MAQGKTKAKKKTAGRAKKAAPRENQTQQGPQMKHEPMQHPGEQQDPQRNPQGQPGRPQRDPNQQEENTAW